ncbi:MAG: hypothetical protein ACQEQL_02660 [Pseudomonadota bacterium]
MNPLSKVFDKYVNKEVDLVKVKSVLSRAVLIDHNDPIVHEIQDTAIKNKFWLAVKFDKHNADFEDKPNKIVMHVKPDSKYKTAKITGFTYG